MYFFCMDKLSKNDLLVFKKLGIERYIGGMSIQYVLPEIDHVSDISKLAQRRLKWMDHYAKARMPPRPADTSASPGRPSTNGGSDTIRATSPR